MCVCLYARVQFVCICTSEFHFLCLSKGEREDREQDARNIPLSTPLGHMHSHTHTHMHVQKWLKLVHPHKSQILGCLMSFENFCVQLRQSTPLIIPVMLSPLECHSCVRQRYITISDIIGVIISIFEDEDEYYGESFEIPSRWTRKKKGWFCVWVISSLAMCCVR